MPHVLVVEDDPMNARLFELTLKRLGGFEVTVTEDPARVLELARQGTIDLVILDISLANSLLDGKPVDGIQIARRLKEEPLTAGIPIILATAHAIRGDRERLLAASGADDYIAKPITEQMKLVELVRRRLKP